MTIVRGGLIQMSLKESTEKSPHEIARAMLEAHVPLIEQAGQAGRAGPVLPGGVHPALFLSQPGLEMVRRGRADPRGPTTG